VFEQVLKTNTMKKSFQHISLAISVILIALSTHTLSWGQADSVRAVHVGLVYPISSNGVQAATYTNRFSLHAIAGVSGNELGTALAGSANIVQKSANGALIAGVFNWVGHSAKGAQIAGVSNIISHEATGIQIAGLLNAAGQSHSVQLAGFANIVAKDAKGAQVAGFMNTGQHVNNQVSGFLNVAKTVKGIQLAGFMNIADSSDYPIGIFNFIKKGEKSISLTFDETMTALGTFRSGGRVLYGIAGVGYNTKRNIKPLYGVEAGLGAHVRLTDYLRLNMEVVNLALSDFKKGTYMKSSVRVMPAYRLGNKLEIFAGPTINYTNYSKDTSKDLVDKYLWSRTKSNDFQGLFLGFTGGLAIIL
jgi:hypothetical protein